MVRHCSARALCRHLRQKVVGVKPFAFQCDKQVTGLAGAAVGVDALDGQIGITMQRCTSEPMLDLVQAEVHVRHGRSPAERGRPMPRVRAAHR